MRLSLANGDKFTTVGGTSRLQIIFIVLNPPSRLHLVFNQGSKFSDATIDNSRFQELDLGEDDATSADETWVDWLIMQTRQCRHGSGFSAPLSRFIILSDIGSAECYFNAIG